MTVNVTGFNQPVVDVRISGTADAIEAYTFSFAGALEVYTGQGRLYLDVPYEIQSLRYTLGTTADTDTIYGLRLNGQSILTANATIIAGQYTTLLTTGFTQTAFVQGDYLTVDIIQAGFTQPGADLTVTIRLKRLS